VRKSDEGEHVMRGMRGVREEERERERDRERREREKDARWKKRKEGTRGNKNVVDGGGCRCEGATVRTRRVYLSCFYRLARTPVPGYADDDDGEDDENDGEVDGNDGEKIEKRSGRRKDSRGVVSGRCERWQSRKEREMVRGGRVTESGRALQLRQPVLKKPRALPEPCSRALHHPLR